VAIAHVGRNGLVPCHNVRVFDFDGIGGGG